MVKLNTECIFEFNDRFLTRVDGCTIGGPLSLLVKFMDILIPSKSLRKKKFHPICLGLLNFSYPLKLKHF